MAIVDREARRRERNPAWTMEKGFLLSRGDLALVAQARGEIWSQRCQVRVAWAGAARFRVMVFPASCVHRVVAEVVRDSVVPEVVSLPPISYADRNNASDLPSRTVAHPSPRSLWN